MQQQKKEIDTLRKEIIDVKSQLRKIQELLAEKDPSELFEKEKENKSE